MENSILNIRPSNGNDDELPINALKQELVLRVQSRAIIEGIMEKFTKRLYEAFESAVAQTTASGIPGLGKPRRIPHPAGDWRQALQIFIEDWSVIIVPLVGSAWPNPKDEARIEPFRFKETCGRIAFFMGDDPTTESFYDFLVFADGAWFAWGFGWPRMNSEIDTTNFETMAFELLTSFVRDIHTTWRPRKVGMLPNTGTALGQSLDSKKRAYNFVILGEE